MMAFNAVLEVDLRAISAESRRKFPAVKDAAEHAILKLRTLSDPASIAKSDDVLKIFLLACETKQVKLSTLGLSCLQKLIAHDAVAPTALPQILTTLKEHSESMDEGVQLKVLQIDLTILQSRLHPEDEENMAVMLGICLRLLGNARNADTVHSTASATLRQAVALIFDRVLEGEALPIPGSTRLFGHMRTTSTNQPGDVSRLILASASRAAEIEDDEEVPMSPAPKEVVADLTPAARLGLRLFEDLHALAAGLPASWLHVPSLPRAFALDMLEYVISHYIVVFRKLVPFEQVLRQRVCSLLMTSLRATGDMDGEGGEPAYRRLVLRAVATVTRLYHSIMTTECEVFLTMLIKSMDLDLPLWHRIMVLEVLRGFCMETRLLRLMYQTFDMRANNTDVVADMVQALARLVHSVQVPEASEESLAAVAGMFSSKAKGIEWTMDFNVAGDPVVVASEAHAITLAVEGLLGVIFTIAILTDEAVEEGELESPRMEMLHHSRPPPLEGQERPGGGGEERGGGIADMCARMVSSVWRTLLEALSVMLSRSQGEAVVLEILKGYQALTTACGVLRMVEPRDAFLESLCSFTLVAPLDVPRPSGALAVLTAGMKRLDVTAAAAAEGQQQQQQQQLRGGSGEGVVLTPKNVQALRTLFNISHRLCTVLGPSWEMVINTLAAVDRTIHSPHATTQEVSSIVPRLSRESIGQSSDFSILSTLDAQLFESSAMMNDSAVKALLAALRSVSLRSLEGVTSGLGPAASGTVVAAGSSGGGILPSSTLKMFAVERMLATLIHNLHRVDRLWADVTVHLLELSDHESAQVRMVALDAFDRAIMAVLNCGRIREDAAAAARAAADRELGILPPPPDDDDDDDDNDNDDEDGGRGDEGLSEDHSKEDKDAAVAATSQERQESHEEASASGRPHPLGREGDMFETVVIMPLSVLYDVGFDMDVRAGALRVLLHVLERHGEKLYHSWPDILELLRLVATAGENDHIPLGFQSVRVIMNDCLSSVPPTSLDMCVEVAGAYAAQKADINISLTAIGLLWTTADFFARGQGGLCISPCNAAARSRLASDSGTPRASTSAEDASSPSPSISSSTAAAFPAPAPPPGAARGLTAVGPGRPEISVSSPLAHQLFQTGPITSPGDAGAAFGAVASKLDKRSGDLLMGVFGVIQGLGTDERPEVRNSAIRTLFQSIVSHGGKLPQALWRHSLWNLIFPLSETVRHLAATASRDEWVGTELGKSAGKSVHMLVHHSRNTAQKQWDETLVMVFNGMSRLFKSFFPLLQAMEGFKQAWASLLQFVEESVLEGSKEVAGAAVTALYVVLHSHATRGNVPRYYWESAFQTYEVIVRGSAHANSRVALKARQEILEHLGELYNQSPALFDKDDYVRALALVDVLARFPSHPGEPAAYAGTLPQVQRTVIDILPKLQPAEASHQPLWPSLLRQLLAYLPGGDRLLCDHCRVPARFLPESKRPGGPGFAGGAELDAYSQQIQLRHQQAGARRGGGSSGVSGADGGDHAHALGTLGNEGAELSEHTHAGPQDAYAAALAAAERLIGTPDGPGSFHLDENGHAQGSGAAADDVEPGHASAAGAPGPPLGSSSAAAPAAAGPGKLPTTTATATTVLTPNAAGGGVGGSSRGKGFSLGGQSELFAPTAVWSGTAENRTGAFMLGFPETAPGALSQVFVERVVALLLLLFRAAPPDVKASTLPDFIAALGRCMAVRRDSPTSQLWRTALVAFHEVLDLALLPDGSGSGSGVGSYHGGGGGGNASADDEDQEGDGGEAGGGVLLLGRQLHAAGSGSSGGGVGSGGAGAGAGAGPGRARLWKEVADVFEKFLLGACGRAASVVGGGSGGEESGGAGGGGGQAAEGLRSDEELEALVLDALCNKVLLCCRDAPEEVKDRLVAVLDLCAGRMSALPLTAVALLPPHCGRFSLACLHRLFVLASRGAPEDAPNASSVAIGRKAMPVLVARCESILQRFTADALNCGARPLPTMRVEEVVVLLQEMARLTIHRHVAAAVDVPICHKDLEDEVDCRSPRARWAARKPTPQRFYDEAGRQLGWQRAHLLLLYTPLCELLLTREPRVAELLRVVLRLIGAELGLLKE